MMESNLRQSLVISQGDFVIFIEHPISAIFIFVTFFLLVSPLIPGIGRKRRKLQETVEGEPV
jgi:putative tricarboxylic transport membrane protein